MTDQNICLDKDCRSLQASDSRMFVSGIDKSVFV